MANLEHCNALWIGGELGLIERACLKSFLNAGHPVRVFCYEKIGAVPKGVEICSAEDILPMKAITELLTFSRALAADWFRYKLQLLSMGYWIDCDVYCVRPFDFRRENVFAWQDTSWINGAVLKLAKDCPMLKDLDRIFEPGFVPPWLGTRKQIRFKVRRLIQNKSFLPELRWGIAGPEGLTYYVKQYGLEDQALSFESFYPLHCAHANAIMDPQFDVERMISKRTYAIHLWNEIIKSYKKMVAPAGSFMERLKREGR